MKLFLIVLFLFLVITIAIIVYLKFYFNSLIYKDLDFMLKNIKNSISFAKVEKNEILSSLKKQVSNISRYTFNNIDSHLFYLKNFERYEIKKCFNSIGSGNVDYEINNIAYYEVYFHDKMLLSKDKLSKDGVMYLKVLIGVGLAICIMLI